MKELYMCYVCEQYKWNVYMYIDVYLFRQTSIGNGITIWPQSTGHGMEQEQTTTRTMKWSYMDDEKGVCGWSCMAGCERHDEWRYDTAWTLYSTRTRQTCDAYRMWDCASARDAFDVWILFYRNILCDFSSWSWSFISYFLRIYFC